MSSPSLQAALFLNLMNRCGLSGIRHFTNSKMIKLKKPLRLSLSLALALAFSLFTAMTTASAPGVSHVNDAVIYKSEGPVLNQIENQILSSVVDHP